MIMVTEGQDYRSTIFNQIRLLIYYFFCTRRTRNQERLSYGTSISHKHCHEAGYER